MRQLYKVKEDKIKANSLESKHLTTNQT